MEGKTRLGGSPSAAGTLTERLGRAFRVTLALIAVTVVITSTVFAAILWLVQPNIARLLRAYRATDQLHEGMLEQETGLRGFLLTGDQSFLIPYREGRERVVASHGALVRLLAPDAKLREEFEAVTRARRSWTQQWAMATLFGPLARTRANRSDSFQEKGQAFFGRYRQAHSDLERSVIHELESARAGMYLLLASAGGLELLLCLVALFMAGRQSKDLRDSIVEPVRNLLAAMESAGKGDLATEVPSSGPLELRQIAAGLREMNAALLRQREVAAESELRLQQANAELSGSIEELKTRNVEGRLLNEMGDLLQTCQVAEEAYAVMRDICPGLFPGDAGALYVTNPSRTLVEAVARWGPMSDSSDAFSPQDCWALRRGAPYAVHPARRQPMCRHIEEPDRSTICVPMTAQGETSGLFYVEVENGGVDEASLGHREQIALQVAERMALALANFRLREKLHNQSIRDPLTDLFNRRYIQETLDREISRARRSGRPLSVIMADIDHFKRFNDTFGHDAGDAVLKLVAGTLAHGIRNEDIACRYGGEEFLLVLPDASLDDASARAEELRSAVAHVRLRHHGRTLDRIHISLGVASYPRHGSSWEQILKAADTALYRAKQEGRDRVAEAAGAPV